MNKKAESVKFIVIVTAALIIIGLGFITFSKEATVTSKTVYSEEKCFSIIDEQMVPTNIENCCSEIRKSQGCRPYDETMYACDGDLTVVVNKQAIDFCE